MERGGEGKEREGEGEGGDGKGRKLCPTPEKILFMSPK